MAALTFGFLLGAYNVRKSSQESVSTQQIPVNFYGINLQKFKVPNKCPFMSTTNVVTVGLPLSKLSGSAHEVDFIF